MNQMVNKKKNKNNKNNSSNFLVFGRQKAAPTIREQNPDRRVKGSATQPPVARIELHNYQSNLAQKPKIN